ncbi:MAG: chemotaxis protein CheW [Candidatus Caenarcaniphilales bacterium]|nr:chemotaxis protein CheW [Candidatus Caenarcaniphilales bacterium]
MIAEFIVDCSENLEQFESNLLDLERDPNAPGILDSMFRMIHSIKGASGFLAFANLESLTHKTESVLDLLRQAKGQVDRPLISTFLDVCDAMRKMFNVIQSEGNDGQESYLDLITKLLKFEQEFKVGAKSTSAESSPAVQESRSDVADERLELDPVQIESLKALGLYDPSEVKTKGEDELEVSGKIELDPVQIEALKSLGMYDENEVTVKASATINQQQLLAETPKVNLDKDTIEKAESKSTKKDDSKKSTVVKETIRVDVDTLDRLVNLAGELVLVRNQLLELAKTNNSPVFDLSFAALDMVTGELQRTLMTTRMQPISVVWSKMPRIVRDLSAQLGRDIDISMHGETTELDKTIIEAISDPMTHIIRNCCDHGIEQPEDREACGKSRKGHIKLIAEHRGNWINVDIIDDGKGISRSVLKKKAVEKGLYTQDEINSMDDQQILNIIFHPGFSTKDQASNISGRGVGMDVIRSNITKINGTVELSSVEGQGTHLKLKLPLTLAIIPAVIVSIEGNRYAIPQSSVQEVASASREEIENFNVIGGQRFTRLRGQILPLVIAHEFLGLVRNQSHDLEDQAEHTLNYVVINADGYRYGLVIDKVLDIIEIVVKPLDSDHDFPYYAGATIMGDGKVALILDATKVAYKAKIDQVKSETETEEIHKSTKSNGAGDLTLLFRLRDGKRYLIPLSKTSRIEEIAKSNIEKRQIGTFAKFNNSIIRIIDLVQLLNLQADSNFDYIASQDTIKSLYFEFHGHGIAIDVGDEHTLLQDDFQIEEDRTSEFVIGTALINDVVYEVLNIEDYLGKVVGDSQGVVNNYAKSQQVNKIDKNKDLNKLHSSDTNSIISFKINDLLFGIDLSSVSEIVSTDEVTATPGSRKSVRGLLNLRGDIMMARNLREVLQLPEINGQEDRRSLIIQNNDKKICLQIGQVDEIKNLEQSLFNIAPNNIPENILVYLKGVYNLNNEMLLVIDEKKLFTESSVETK